jgi:hypothetical protein
MGEASALIDRCYRAHLPTKEQLQTLERIGVTKELPPKPTMGDARDLLLSQESRPPTTKQIKSLTDTGFKVSKGKEMTAAGLDVWIKLAEAQPEPDDVKTLRAYGLKFSGDGFATAVLVCLIGHFQNLSEEFVDWQDADEKQERLKIARACIAAMRDPAYSQFAFKPDENFGGVTIAWPKSKLKEWFS